MIVLLYGIHLANILSSRLELMVCSTWPFVSMIAMCSDYHLQILSLSLVTPGPRRQLSTTAPLLGISMHLHYLRMAYT
jgi:hypothetical protein